MDPDFAWPKGFAPSEARVYVRNELSIAAPPAAVWGALVAAPLWTSWFPSATNVKLPAEASELEPGMRFSWSQIGYPLDTVVREFTAPNRVAWMAISPSLQAYHAWDIREVEGGCHVITDETQHGIVPTLFGFFVRRRMLRLHDLWLAKLAERAAIGPGQGGSVDRGTGLGAPT